MHAACPVQAGLAAACKRQSDSTYPTCVRGHSLAASLALFGPDSAAVSWRQKRVAAGGHSLMASLAKELERLLGTTFSREARFIDADMDCTCGRTTGAL